MARKKIEKKVKRRAHGEGSVYKTKDGKYGAAISLGKDENGKRRRKVITGKTEDEVIEKMKKFITENKLVEADEEEEEPIIDSETLVEEFVKEFKINRLLSNRDVSSRTYENYDYCLKIFENYFVGKKIGKVNTKAINDFFRYMEKREPLYSQVTLNRVEFIVNKMFKRASSKRFIKNNPFDDEDYSKPKSKKPPKEVLGLTDEEVKTFYMGLKGNPILYTLFLLLINTGMRMQEAIGLRWGNVDLENGIIKVREAITINVEYDSEGNKIGRTTVLGGTKQGSGDRDIYISDIMSDLLREWKVEAPKISKTKTGDDNYVFGNKKHECWTFNGLRSSVDDYVKKKINGLERIGFHRIRHTVATMLAEDGATLPQIMKLLGHTQAKTTLKYINRVSSRMAESNKERIGRNVTERFNIM